MRKLIQNPVINFLMKAIGLYILWLFVYELWLHPIGGIDRLTISNIIFFSGELLKLLGFDLINEFPFDENFRTLGIDGGHSLWVGDPCNGLSLFALYAGFIIAYPGKIKNKILAIPIGIIAIHLVNILRVVVLCIIAYYSPETLDFNHTYTFTITVYSFVFLLWYLWATKWNFR